MVAASKIVLLVSTAAAGVFAAPVTSQASGAKTFTVPAVHNDNYHRNGTAAMMKAYAKYGLKPLHPGSVLNRRQDGSVVATPAAQDVQYLCPVSIGGQTLNLDFDTGSADLWVFSTLLDSTSIGSHSAYDSTQSSTYQDISSTWSIQYADGSGASGIVGTDTVTIGGTTVQTQAVELANNVSSSFTSGNADGLVGLAFSSINTVQPTPQSTFFDNAQSSLNSPLFAAYLPWQTSGAYDFGATDSSKFSGSPKYAAVDNSQGFWQFNSASYKVGSQTFAASGTVGIADTGTTLVLMGDAQVQQYYSGVQGAQLDNTQGGYTFPCGTTLPSLSFLIGDSDYATIPAKYLSFAPTDNTGTTCFGSLQSVGTGGQNIYGDVFFNAYYGIFDANGPQFGFAPTL